ncbi:MULTISPECIES: Imm5 family immunity protein [Actinomyces]|uniref:Immunity protein imm5 n=1 Tax=Actinomyces glycerinitolerans TaxID=1892869 RepID=A0A1M4S3K7_9ACTO|nr:MULTISPECIES: Imm5 family immunity protein [Actinomyces]RAX21995.1 immunity protein [Actinomyces sp. Z3]RAX24086.1 immunity protein [Actinomyces sp. Z5]SHE26812.1 immunity protein imm5 [Actinomyces glycerinitolerans]
MIDTTVLNREISAGRTALSSSDEAILPLGVRRRIWAAMQDPDDDDATYRRRVELAILCVKRVQHIWDRGFPGDAGVSEMLTLAQELVNEQADPEQAEWRAETFLDNVLDSVSSFDAIVQPATFVADAASRTVISACYRNPDYDTADPETDDDELLPDSLEPSYSCASAAAGALNWQPIEETDVEARREFWTWYLDEAIPQVLAE